MGTLKLTMRTLIAEENQRLTLSVYQPVDTVTRSRLQTLHGWINDGSIERRREDGVDCSPAGSGMLHTRPPRFRIVVMTRIS